MPPQGGRKHPHQEFLQIDTTNILFICGGAFGGLDAIIERRIGKKTMGFGADIASNIDKDLTELYKNILPEDLLKYGLIPEFVGRVPIIVTLHQLEENALVSILTQPKNALVKQFTKLMDMDGVQLEFEDDALKEIAKLAIERKTGARGLRAILEAIMLDVMYDIPSRDDVKKCVITKDTVRNAKIPMLILGEKDAKKKALPKAQKESLA